MNSIAFMHAAYIVVWVILGGYLIDLGARYLKLKKELRDLDK
jgi:CcmD family protein